MSSWREMLEEAKFLLSEGLISEKDYQDLKTEALNLMKQSRFKKSSIGNASTPISTQSDTTEDTLTGTTLEVKEGDALTGSDTLDGRTIEQDVVLSADTLEGDTQQGMTLMGQSLELREDNCFQLQKGTMFDQRYTIALPLGKGGMGMVYQAVDTMTGQQVALKVLLPKFAKQKKVIDSLVHEFSLGQRLNHPNLLQIRHLETRGNTPYIVMELMDGGDVAELASSRGEVLSPKELLPVLESVCSALSALHKEAIVHLDIKPQNILLATDGRIRLADFGISSRMKDQRGGHSGAGTPWYAAPEQLDREVCGVGTDVYAVGMMTYRLLSGGFPFAKSATLEEIKQWHKKGKRKFLGVDPALRPILKKACHPSIDKRYRDVQDLYIAISQQLVDNTSIEDRHQNPKLEKYRELYIKVMEDGYLEEWEKQQLEAARQKWNIRELQAKQIEADFLAKCSAELEVVYNFKHLLSAKAMDNVSIGLEFNNISLLNLEKIEVRFCSVGWNVQNLKTFSLQGQKSHTSKLSLCLDSVWTYNFEMMVHVQDFIGNDQYFVATQLPFSFDLAGVKPIQWEDRLVDRLSDDKWKVSLMLSDQSTWQAFAKGDDKGKSEFENGRKKQQKHIEQRHAEEFLQRSKAWESSLKEYIELETVLKNLEKEVQVASEKQIHLRQSLDTALEEKNREQEETLNQKSKARKELQAEMEGLESVLDEIPTLKEALRGRIFAKFNDDIQPRLSEEMYKSLEKSSVASDFIRTLNSLDLTDVTKISAVTKHSLTTDALKDVLVKIIRKINVGYNQDPLKSEAKELDAEVSRLNSKIESYQTKEMDLLSRRMDLTSKLKEEEAKFFSFFVKKTIQSLQEEDVQVVAELEQIEQSIQHTKKEINDKKRDVKNRTFSAKQREYRKYSEEMKALHSLYNDVRMDLVYTLQRKVERHNTDKRNFEMELKEHQQQFETEYAAEEQLLVQKQTEEYNTQKSLIEERIETHEASVVERESTFAAERDDFIASEEQKIAYALEGIDVAQLSADISKRENALSALERKLLTVSFPKEELLKYEHLVSDTVLLYYSTFALNMNLRVSDLKSSLVKLNQAVYKLLKAKTYNLQAPHLSVIVKQSASVLKSHPKITVLSTKSNIQEAIDAAQTGEILVLLKGVYEQNITISKDVYLLGQSGATIRGVSDTNVVQIQDSSPILYGLNIDSVFDSTDGMDDLSKLLAELSSDVLSSERLIVVEGENTKPTIADCFFTSKVTSGVLCRGACTQLMNNRFDGVGGYGVKFAKSSTGKLEDCTLIKTGKEGVIVDGANPQIVGCQIYDGQNNGVWIKGKGRGTIQSNKIFRNVQSAINVQGHSNPEILDNEIYDGESAGIRIVGESTGTIKNNDIYNNKRSGIEIKEKSNPKVFSNNIHHSQSAGIFISANGHGVIRENTIQENKNAGIEVSESNPTIQSNTLSNGKYIGILVHKSSDAIIENNKITGHSSEGVAVKKSSNATIVKNTIKSNGKSGILSQEGSTVKISENEISANKSVGIEITDKTKGVVSSNKVFENTANGIKVVGCTEITIEKNTIYKNESSGIRVDENAIVLIDANTIRDGLNGGVLFQSSSEGLMTENKIYGNKLANVACLTKSFPSIQNNQIYNGQSTGIWVSDSSPKILTNKIYGHEKSNIFVEKSSSVTIEKNQIHSSKLHGVSLQNGVVNMTENTVYDNHKNGLNATKDSKGKVLKNDFTENKEGDVNLANGCRIKSERNKISRPAAFTKCIFGKVVKHEMVYLPGGRFWMGAIPSDRHAKDYEKPRFEVEQTRPILISIYPVTYDLYYSADGSRAKEDFKRKPAKNSFKDLLAICEFCNKLSKLEGLTPAYTITGDIRNAKYGSGIKGSIVCNWDANGYRLPSEAEWEYAARGGEYHLYSGSNTLLDVAVVSTDASDNSAYAKARLSNVGTKKQNGYGIFDMSGLVLEICWDSESQIPMGEPTPHFSEKSVKDKLKKDPEYFDKHWWKNWRMSKDWSEKSTLTEDHIFKGGHIGASTSARYINRVSAREKLIQLNWQTYGIGVRLVRTVTKDTKF